MQTNNTPNQQPQQQPIRLHPEDAQPNIASIRAVPSTILPIGKIRTGLQLLAEVGADVYCYQSGPVSGRWNCWLLDRRIPLQPHDDGEPPITYADVIAAIERATVAHMQAVKDLQRTNQQRSASHTAGDSRSAGEEPAQ